MSLVVGHACCGSYEMGLYGGVPRFDHQLKRTFPNRALLVEPWQIKAFCEAFPNAVVFADNHYAIHVKRNVRCIVVHHGCAAEHYARTQDPSLAQLAEAQGQIWSVRSPSNTLVVSCSTFCVDTFLEHYGSAYAVFPGAIVLHACEHDNDIVWKPLHTNNGTIHVLGNFSTAQKRGFVDLMSLQCADIKVHDLRINIAPDETTEDFQRRKQLEYMKNDVFVQLSICEGYSYATLDALSMGMPVVSTPVGLCYKDLPENAFVKIECGITIEEIRTAIRCAHAAQDELSKYARAFCQANTRFMYWQAKMKTLADQVRTWN